MVSPIRDFFTVSVTDTVVIVGDFFTVSVTDIVL